MSQHDYEYVAQRPLSPDEDDQLADERRNKQLDDEQGTYD